MSTEPVQHETDDSDISFDDMLKSMGMDNASITTEDMLWQHLTDGKYQKIHNLRYWLTHEMARFNYLLSQGVKVTKNVYDKEKRTVIDRPISVLEFGKLSIKYYLLMYHLPWFEKLNVREACDMAAIVDRVAEHEIISETINKKHD